MDKVRKYVGLPGIVWNTTNKIEGMLRYSPIRWVLEDNLFRDVKM